MVAPYSIIDLTRDKVYKDCETTNIIERRLIKNSKGLEAQTVIQNNLNIHSSWKQLSTRTNNTITK
jgi:hypothetical protein